VTYKDRTLGSFCTALAAEEVPPAGGTTAAVAGAFGASLCEMTCRHVDIADLDLDGDADTPIDRLAAERERLLELADADAAVVAALFAGEATPAARERGVEVPLAVAESCLAVLEVGGVVAQATDRPVVVDAYTGLFLAQGAFRAAVVTARSNLPTVADDRFADAAERRAAELSAAAADAAEHAPPDTDPTG
jgi:formiminotetrahydrofolate cyclodeaminase